MKYGILLISILMIITLPPLFISESEGSNSYTLVAGFYTEIEYDGTSTTEIELYNEYTSYYWKYDGEWVGDVEFLDTPNSSFSDGRWKVRLGVDVDEIPGEWNLLVDGTEQNILVETPNRAIEIIKPDMMIRFEPYEITTKTSQMEMEFNNCGNIQAKYWFEYRDTRLSPTNSDGVISPGEKLKSSFVYSSEEWSPRIIKIPTSLYIRPMNAISNKTFQFIPQWKYDFDVEITVGYEGFIVVEESGYTVQYKKYTESKINTEKTLSFYVYGDVIVPISRDYHEIQVLTESIETPYSIDLGDIEEHNYQTDIKTKECDGSFSLMVNNKRYTTEINVPEQDNFIIIENPDYTKPIMWGLCVICGIGVIIGMRIYFGGRE